MSGYVLHGLTYSEHSQHVFVTYGMISLLTAFCIDWFLLHMWRCSCGQW